MGLVWKGPSSWWTPSRDSRFRRRRSVSCSRLICFRWCAQFVSLPKNMFLTHHWQCGPSMELDMAFLIFLLFNCSFLSRYRCCATWSKQSVIYFIPRNTRCAGPPLCHGNIWNPKRVNDFLWPCRGFWFLHEPGSSPFENVPRQSNGYTFSVLISLACFSNCFLRCETLLWIGLIRTFFFRLEDAEDEET